MSGIGYKRTFWGLATMSAFGGKADVGVGPTERLLLTQFPIVHRAAVARVSKSGPRARAISMISQSSHTATKLPPLVRVRYSPVYQTY